MKGCLSGMALMLLSTCVAATQLEIKNIGTPFPNSAENQFRLPWFTSADNPGVAKRINDFIFSRFLRHLPGNDPQTMMNQLAKSEKDLGGIAALDYSVEYLDDKRLTLNIFAEGCGAYCESYNTPLNVDLTSGAIISLDEIVSANAIAQLDDRVSEDIRKKITAFIAQQKALPANEQRVEDGEVVDYAQFYADCLARTNDKTGFTRRFYLKDQKLVFLNERCSNHASRALDDLGEFTTEIPISVIEDALTPYGKNILTVGRGEKLSPSPNLNNTLLYGTLGKSMRIVLNTTCEYSYLSGAYFYEKYGTPIELTGKCSTGNNQHYELTTVSDETAKETITLDLKDGHYQGSWESNGKTLPIRFE